MAGSSVARAGELHRVPGARYRKRYHHDNVHTDTSGVRRFDLLVQAVRRAGAHKVLFGSDGPWLHPALELEKIRLLQLGTADEALVLGGNLLRLTPRARLTPTAAAGRAAAAAHDR